MLDSTRSTTPNTAFDTADFGRRRVLIFDVSPSVDSGRYPTKRVQGDLLTVECDLVSDGHDTVAGCVRYREEREGAWNEVPLAPLGNDRYVASFRLPIIGRYQFSVEAWTDEYASWCSGLARKCSAGQDVSVELLAGVAMLEAAALRCAKSNEAESLLLSRAAALVRTAPMSDGADLALETSVRQLMAKHPERRFSTRSSTLEVVVDPPLARFSSWYELFPRSFGRDGAHGTFADVEELLPYVASMGFDVLYLPPIHPIGLSFRKGPNNRLEASPDDPGSPWAIGSVDGGHKGIHPELGTEADFKRLVAKANDLGLHIALDIAFQASPDHPYVRRHPEWFMHRADGSIQYAENPPKKYQDVYPFDLSGPAWEALWAELKSVFEVWIARGVRVFRVDNPHTKPIPFWEHCIRALKREHPDVLFLAEAFTRPKLMYALAKVGFSQSYTYFTWRTTSADFKEYLTELTSSPVSNFFRPNFWPNTPDILPEHLQEGGRPMFVVRMILAGTLAANWGIYGPAFELLEHVPRPGSEEYIDNEKFQLRSWDLQAPHSLKPMITQLNAIRRENSALQSNDNLVFHETDNDKLLVYSKTCSKTHNVILVVVNLEPRYKHSGWLSLKLDALLSNPAEQYEVHDLLSNKRYSWYGARNYVELDPAHVPAHIFRLRPSGDASP